MGHNYKYLVSQYYNIIEYADNIFREKIQNLENNNSEWRHTKAFGRNYYWYGRLPIQKQSNIVPLNNTFTYAWFCILAIIYEKREYFTILGFYNRNILRNLPFCSKLGLILVDIFGQFMCHTKILVQLSYPRRNVMSIWGNLCPGCCTLLVSII